MSILSVYQDSVPEQPLKVLTHLEDIAATLAEAGVHLERCDASVPIGAGASPEEVMAAYRPQIDRLKQERGYVTVDVISLSGNPPKAGGRANLSEEHRHAGDEVRFVVAGRGLFNFHIEDRVYAVLCERNDLIAVPAGTRQWFDIAENSHLVAIRLFNDAEGMDAQATGEDIAGRFPRLDDF